MHTLVPILAIALLALVLCATWFARTRHTVKVPEGIAAWVDATMARNRLAFSGFVFELTIADLIAKKREKLTPLLEQRQAQRNVISGVRTRCDTEDREPNEQETGQVNTARAEVARIDAEIAPIQAEIDQLEAEQRADQDADDLSRQLEPSGAQRGKGKDKDRAPTTVTGEPRTYTPERSMRGEASFFSDAYNAKTGSMAARDRLERNLREAEVEGELSERATTTGSFAGLVVPQYLVDLAAAVVRSGRPVANAVTGLPLPSQGMSLVIPRGTTGAAAASQATENTALQNTDEVWANLTVPVVTVGGQQDVSRQSLERGTPGLDEIVYLDLASAYHAELDRQVVNGSGASNQMLGIFQTAGINAATVYGAPITFTNFNSKVAGQIAAIAGVGQGIMPRLIFMHPRRWGWMSSLVDGAGRPLVVPQAQGVFNAGGVNTDPGGYGGDTEGGTVIVGSMQGLPITTDANVPTSVGTNVEDLTGVMDTTKALLWEEGDGNPRQLRFEETAGGNLTVKLVAYGYAAFTAGRHPAAFGKTGGLDTGGAGAWGQIAPTF